MKVRCICLGAKNKPSEIPLDKWPEEYEVYHITHIYLMVNQNQIQGCELAEFDISDCKPFNCYRLSRFAIFAEDFEIFMRMMAEAAELNNISIDSLIDQINHIEKG